MSSALIKKCNCKNTQAANYQDKIYGDGMRVCNVSDKKDCKCTVCGTTFKL